MESVAIEPPQGSVFEQQQNDSHCSEACNRSDLHLKLQSMEEMLTKLQKEHDQAQDQIHHLQVRTREAIQDRDSLLERTTQLEASFRNTEFEYERKLNEEASRNEELNKEVSFLKHLVERLESELENVEGRNGSWLKMFNSLNPVKESLLRILKEIEDDEMLEKLSEEDGITLEDEDMREVSKEMNILGGLAREGATRVKRFKETTEKEKIDLRRSVVSLTEENRDTNTLFRVALVEKEAVEKKMREGNTDQKKAALVQIYERGLRGVGFGFIMGGGDQDSLQSNTFPPSSASTASTKSELSDHEEEGENLGSIVEKMMKNLRSEILQLRTWLAESRSENEQMQTLAQKQSHELATTMEYVSELEEKETMLIQNIEGLELEIKQAEAEAARWREACESEVKAGKGEIDEREKLVSILKGELEKTKSALEIANGRVRLKEELAEAAMAAQEAAERSLQLADGRSAELRQRIEVLAKEMEEVESRGRRLHWTRQICLPWQLLRYESLADANSRFRSTRFLPPLPQGTS